MATKLKANEHRLYVTWKNMRQRCTNPRATSYKYHGARGVKICDKWDDFWSFIDDMGSSYQEGLTLDRIDVNGDYCKENCRWATWKIQGNNKRRSRVLTYKNESHTITDWAEKIGVKRSTLAQRFYVYKWPVSKVLTV